MEADICVIQEDDSLSCPTIIKPDESSMSTFSESPTKRKRGRPRKEEGRKSAPIEPRFIPDRMARHKKHEIENDSELMPSTSSDDTLNRSSRKTPRKRVTNKRKSVETGARPRGRPKKVVKKLVCIVRPMIQSTNENKPRKCGWSGCGNIANSVRSLKNHVEREHLNHLTQYACQWDSCTRINPFNALYKLSLHLRSHIGEKPCECRICGKTYTRQENLKTHIRSHQNNRAFPCRIADCDKTFFSASDRSKHQARTHAETKAYKCPVEGCLKDYTDPSSLRKHIKKVHGGEIFNQAKQNKQRNGPGSDYGIIPSSTSVEPQPSTSQEI